MSRFAFIIFLVLSIAGCQTVAHNPQKTILVRSEEPITPVQKFWIKTAQLLQPLKPDGGNRRAESDGRFAASCATDLLPVPYASHSLYQAGSIFPSTHLVPPNPTEDVPVAETVQVAVINPNPLQIQSGDSEAFKKLLREVAIVPPEQRKVEDARLETLLATFRDSIMDSDVETEFIDLLRKQILPELESSAAPLPNTALAETKRSVSNPLRSQSVDWDEDDFEEPTARQIARRLPQRNEEPKVAQNSTAAPVYPDLMQLPGAVPATVQTSYQAQSIPTQAPHLAGYGVGDWQSSTRQAIEQLRYTMTQTPNGGTESNEIKLRLLEMVLGNKAEAVRPIPSADKTVNEFLGHQVLGFAALLDDSMQNDRSRYVSAVYRFSEGLQELQNLCPIKLKNVMFVDDMIAYGQYIARNSQEFYPGEDALVYMEIENPSMRRFTDRIGDGFEVGVAISYEIRDAHARVVVRQDAGKPAERSLSRKRDFAMTVGPIPLPTSLPPGQYQLRISVTDLNDDSMQYTEEQIPFRIAPTVETGR